MLCSSKSLPVSRVNNPSRLRLPALCLVLLLVGCSSLPSDSDSMDASAAPAKETEGDCLCHIDGSSAELDLAIEALLGGETERARTALDMYRESDQSGAEAQAQVLLSLLDLLEAGGYSPPEHGHHGSDDRVALAEMMLQLIVRWESESDQLVAENEVLKADLEKREEAIKRLRELTLGQPEV